eukprot:TRINITY_DN14558_c0_g1_i3.p1 TRINITY_DN14558_c0_g1~~TRINITY_DN14558_c0_g1_i3.p1  ORF type:complete len:1275 (-),score=284.03 TRINITY_DN14558_c0_g1_i3:367-4191(-)
MRESGEMAPPPPLRPSPGRVTKAKTEVHKRGRSLEILKHKDEDLALFNDMETKERDNFLHHSGDESDDSLTIKLRDLSDFRINVSAPAHRDGCDLLSNDVEKTDYDWLLTPPDTPLFRSLDDDTPLVNVIQRGRPRNQPIRISNASRTKTGSSAGRSSASPRRGSPTSASSAVHRRKASPGPSGSVSPTLRSLTPPVRSSTPQSKPSTPNLRSTTPTLRRSNTGSAGRVGSAVKAGRGKSSSPKPQSWHSSHPEFAAEPPPNLRTTIGERPPSRTRGSSPASSRGLSPASTRGLSPISTRGLSPVSRHGSEPGTGSRRHSVSPTARSVCSSNSCDRDHVSSQSKGSAVSSCDDEFDSLQSAFSGRKKAGFGGTAGRQATRKLEPFPNSKINSFSRRPIRSTSAIHVSASSAAKRSFDSTLRQMDLHRNSQSMFRPLLSSVPPTSFYTNKVNNPQGNTYSSSVTATSDASAMKWASVAQDTEGIDHDQHDEEDFVRDSVVAKSEDTQGTHMHVDGKKSEGCECNGLQSSVNDFKIHLDEKDSSGITELVSQDKSSFSNVTDDMYVNMKDIPRHMDDGHVTNSQSVDASCADGHVIQSGSIAPMMLESNFKTDAETVVNDDLSSGSFVDIPMDVAGNISNLRKSIDGKEGSCQLAAVRSLETEAQMKSISCSGQGVQSSGKQDITASPVSSQQFESTTKHGPQGSSVSVQYLLDHETSCLKDSNSNDVAIKNLKQALTQVRDGGHPHSLQDLGENEGLVEKYVGDKTTEVPPEEYAGKSSSEHKTEFSYRTNISSNILNRASSCKWPSAHTKASINTNLSDQSTQLRQVLNDLRVVRSENAMNSDSICNSVLTKQAELKIQQSSSKSVDAGTSVVSSTITMVCGNPNSTLGVSSDNTKSISHESSTQDHGPFAYTDVFEATGEPGKYFASGHLAVGYQNEAKSRYVEEHAYGGMTADQTSKHDSLFTDKNKRTENGLTADMAQEECFKSNIGLCSEKRADQTSKHDSLFTDKNKRTENGLTADMAQEECFKSNIGLCSEKRADNGSWIDFSNNGYGFNEVGKVDFQDSCQDVSEHNEKNTKGTENDYQPPSIASDASNKIPLGVNTPHEDSYINGGGDSSHHTSESQHMASSVGVDHTHNVTEASNSTLSKENTEMDDLKCSDTGSLKTDHAKSTQDSTSTVDAPRSYLSRNLTLEEATDTILFCSSIVHDLAYKAVNIAMEKENKPIEPLLPVMVTSRKTGMDHRSTCAGTSSKRNIRLRKVRSRCGDKPNSRKL